MERSLLVFGDSNSEVLDYIFGDNPNYYPFWSSGWSARGLRKLRQSEKGMIAYNNVLESVSKDTNIFLHFGNVDIDFNLPHKIHNERFYNFPLFLDEAYDGLLTLHEYLSHKGFTNIYAIFTAPPIDIVDKRYWKYPYLPAHTRGRLMLDFAEKVSKSVLTINCLYNLILDVNNPVCSPTFVRITNNHHPNYIKTQDIIYNKINFIPKMLPMRNPKHTQLYEHIGYHQRIVESRGQPRPRTCR